MEPTDPVIKASVFIGLPEFVASRGFTLDLEGLLAEVGLLTFIQVKKTSPGARGAATAVECDPELYVPLDAVSRAFELIAARTGLPCFGLEYADHYPVGASGSVGFLLAHAPTMREALGNLVNYIHAFTRPMHIELIEADGGVAFVEWVFPLEFTAAMPQYVSFALGTVIKRLRRIAGPDWTPLQVELIHRELPCRDLYQARFGKRVRFETPKNRMWIDPTALARHHPDPDMHVYRIAKTLGASELEKLAATARHPTLSGIRAQLRDHLATVVSQGTPELDAVAAALKLEPRQLQTHLSRENTSFSDELSEVRKLIAERLLVSTTQSMTEIASAVGFSELSSLTRACRELWFGMSPSKFRKRMQEEQGLLKPPRKTRADKSSDSGAGDPGDQTDGTGGSKVRGDDWSERD